MERWPNFFIVGSTKAGTTSIHEYLNRIPGIFMSPIKEPHYFSRNDISKNNPLSSRKDLASTKITSGMSNFLKIKGMKTFT